MGGFQTLKAAGLAAIAAGAFSAAPAAADRCGGSYPVDAPTTLSEVARQCNVHISELREANPGVDPDNVRPGARLAVPDEIDEHAIADAEPGPAEEYAQTSFADATDARAPVTDDTGLAGDAHGVVNFRGDDARAAHRVRVRDHRAPDAAPVWMAREAMQGSRYSTTANLSYQKLSARRIHHAGPGLPISTGRYASAPGAAETRLVECTVTEKGEFGDIDRMRKIVSTPENTFIELDRLSDGDAFDCTLIGLSDTVPLTPGVPAARFVDPDESAPGYRLPDYGMIGLGPADATPRGPSIFALAGEIVDSYRGCLLLQTRNGGLWRLSASQPAGDLLGKQVTVWGASVVGGACGDGPSMAVSHAVYAEPWPAN